MASCTGYFHSTVVYISLNMPFFVALCHFCFKISPDSNNKKAEKTVEFYYKLSKYHNQSIPNNLIKKNLTRLQNNDN